MLALPRQHMRRHLSDITQRDRRKLVVLTERSWECMLFTHVLCIEEHILSIDAGTERLDQHKKVGYLSKTGEIRHTGSQPESAQLRCSHSLSRRE